MGERALKIEEDQGVFVRKCLVVIYANTNHVPGNISSHMVKLHHINSLQMLMIYFYFVILPQ